MHAYRCRLTTQSFPHEEKVAIMNIKLKWISSSYSQLNLATRYYQGNNHKAVIQVLIDLMMISLHFRVTANNYLLSLAW